MNFKSVTLLIRIILKNVKVLEKIYIEIHRVNLMF